jgi:hypothetical protein
MTLDDLEDYEVVEPTQSSKTLQLDDLEDYEVAEPLKTLQLDDLDDYEVVDSAPSENKMGVGEAALTGFGEGASLGWGDELAGAVGATIDRPVTYLMDRFSGVPSDLAGEPEESTFGERYKQTRDFARRQQEKAKEDQAGAYYGGMLTGGIATGVATGGVGAKALAGRAVAEGAVAGLGGSEADLTKGEYGQAAEDTAIGGIAGGLIPQAGKIAGGIYKTAGDVLGGALSKTGKGIKKATQFVTGVKGDADKKIIEGASEILGVPKNELNLEVVEYLKSKGLGWSKKEKLLQGIGDDLKNLTDPDEIKRLKDIESLVNNSKIGLFDEIKRSFENKAVKDLQTAFVGEFISGSPGGFTASKKVRDLMSSRMKLDAPKYISKGEQISSAVSDPLQKAGQKAQEFGQKATGFYDDLIKEPGARIPLLKGATEKAKEQQYNSNIYEKTSGTKYEDVFVNADPQQAAVRHKLLMERDPEYRALYNENQLNEE